KAGPRKKPSSRRPRPPGARSATARPAWRPTMPDMVRTRRGLGPPAPVITMARITAAAAPPDQRVTARAPAHATLARARTHTARARARARVIMALPTRGVITRAATARAPERVAAAAARRRGTTAGIRTPADHGAGAGR